jgi:thiol-disulfide isomerase/thioredoxin
MLRRIVFVLAAMLAIASLFSCGGDKSAKESTAQQGSPQAATQQPATQQAAAQPIAVPELQFTTLDAQGVSQSSTQWIGKQPVVLNFWGTWCGPCRREIPDLVKLYDEYHQRGIQIVGLAVNDDPKDVLAFAGEHQMQWTMLMATDDIRKQYDVVNGVPTTIFLDQNGKEINRFIGNRAYEDFKPSFEAILNGYTPKASQ